MTRLLLGALAMGAVFVLTSFALLARSAPTPKTPGGPAWKVSEYQMDRAFRIQVPLSGATGQVPTSGGFIITQIRTSFPGGTTGSYCSITVNGATENFQFNYQGQAAIELTPPIICRPSDVVTITVGDGVWIAGYTTYPGET